LLGRDYRLALVGGSVYSTARELARFARAMADGGRGLMPEAAFQRVVRRPFPGQPYGYGWSLQLPKSSDTAVGLRHNGALAASRAALTIDLESGRYAVVLYSVAGAPGEAEKRVQAALRVDHD
jgi:CubicO group peptidase (beta-lactamase class C family)